MQFKQCCACCKDTQSSRSHSHLAVLLQVVAREDELVRQVGLQVEEVEELVSLDHAVAIRIHSREQAYQLLGLALSKCRLLQRTLSDHVELMAGTTTTHDSFRTRVCVCVCL
jgi:hypothetical protein